MGRTDDDRVLDRWFMRATIERRRVVRPGEGPATGTVTVWDPRRELAYRGPFPADGDAHVTWTLSRSTTAPRHASCSSTPRSPSNWAAGYGSGWHSYLDRLAACLAGERPPDWAERLAEVRPLYDGA